MERGGQPHETMDPYHDQQQDNKAQVKRNEPITTQKGEKSPANSHVIIWDQHFKGN